MMHRRVVTAGGLLVTLLSVVCVPSAPASAAPGREHCSDSYDAVAKSSIASLLKTKYGAVAGAFDVERPGLMHFIDDRVDVVETASGHRVRVDPDRVGWWLIHRSRPAPSGVPSAIVVAMGCANNAIGFYVLSMDDEYVFDGPPK